MSLLRARASFPSISRSLRYLSTEAATTSAPTPPPLSSSSSTPNSESTAPLAPSRPATASPSSSSSLPPATTPVDASAPSPVFGRHIPLPPTHGVHVATLHLRSYTDAVPSLQFFTSFALRSAKALGLPTSGAVALPTRTSLYTAPRSPFAHKKSQQNFWRKEHKRAIKVFDGNEKVVTAWLAYLRKEALAGVGMKAQVFTYREPGWGGDLVGKAEEEEQRLAASGASGGDVEQLAQQLEEELRADVEAAEQAGEHEEVESGGDAVEAAAKELKEVTEETGEKTEVEVPVKGQE